MRRDTRRPYIEELDPTARREHVRDPMELVALVIVVVAALVAGASALLPPPPTPAAISPPSGIDTLVASLPRPSPSGIPQPALTVHGVPGNGCGPLDATGAYPDEDFRFARGVTQIVALNTDPRWTWCVIGIRAYTGGVEVVGRLTFVPDDVASGPAPGRPHALLRDSSFALAIDGFGEIGAAKITPASSGRVALRFATSADPAERERYLNALAATPWLILRLLAIDDGAGSYAFRGPPPDPRLVSDHTAIAGQYGLGAFPRSAQPTAALPLH